MESPGAMTATLYYRKIAEIVLRDERAPALRYAAHRVLATGRGTRDRLVTADKRALKAWMLLWCDAATNPPAASAR